jgi:exosome complex component RRP4
LCVCVNGADDQDIPAEGRKAIATVASILSIFAQHNIPITDGLINDAYAWVQGRGIGHGPLSSEEGDRLMLEVVDVDVSA